MSLYLVRMGPNVALSEGGTADAARDALAKRLGVANRPWVVRTWKVDLATRADVERYGALVDASRRGKAKKPSTVTKLKRKHSSLFDDDGPAAA